MELSNLKSLVNITGFSPSIDVGPITLYCLGSSSLHSNIVHACTYLWSVCLSVGRSIYDFSWIILMVIRGCIGQRQYIKPLLEEETIILILLNMIICPFNTIFPASFRSWPMKCKLKLFYATSRKASWKSWARPFCLVPLCLEHRHDFHSFRNHVET